MEKKEFLEYVEKNRANIGIYRFTGPAEHWITAYEKRVWGFNRNNRHFWEKLKKGDVAIFHSSQSDFSKKSGIIGLGIIEGVYVKEDIWWYAELKNDQNIWPYVISFSDLYFTGDVKQIETARPIIDRSKERVIEQCEILLQNSISLNDIKNNVSISGKNYNFPVLGSASSVADESMDYIFKRLSELNAIEIEDEDFKNKSEEEKEGIETEYAISKKLASLTEEDRIKFLDEELKRLREESLNYQPKEVSVQRKQRFNKTATILKEKFGNKCQVCGYTFLQKNGRFYSEVAHITPWSESHDDTPENLLVLCPNHHKEFDNGKKETRERIIEEIRKKRPDFNYKV